MFTFDWITQLFSNKNDSEEWKMFKQIAKEINAINTVLRERDIDAYVEPKGVLWCVPGNFIRYTFVPQTEKARDSLKPLGDRWMALISTERGSMYELPIVWNKHMFILDTPGILEQKSPQWEDAPLDQLRTGDLLLGRAFTDTKSLPMIINLRNSSTPHALVAAMTGGGKTYAVVQALLSVCYATNPKKLMKFMPSTPKASS